MKTTPSLRTLCFALLAAFTLAQQAFAGGPLMAPITWGPAQNISGDSDIITTGSLAYAYSFGSSGTSINGVAFSPFITDGVLPTTSITSGNVTLSEMPGQLEGRPTGSVSVLSPFMVLSSDYQTLLGSAVVATQQDTMILQLGGLTVGKTYSFQWWSNDSWDWGDLGPTITNATNSVTLDANLSNEEGGTGQFAVGQFTATGTSQSIAFNGESPSSFPTINGFQLRTAPATILYWLGSNGTLWSAVNNWSDNATGTPTGNFTSNASIVFSATGSSNSSATNLGGNLTVSSLTINSTNPVGISGGNLTVNGDISVGSSSSNNSLQISNGVAVVGASYLLVGAETGSSNNQVTVGANSTLTLTDDIYVGGNGSSNNLTITNGGAVSAFYMSAGREVGANENQVTVGANSTLAVTDLLDVGFYGSSNNLTITNGGAVSANYTSAGREADSNNNTILVTSNASMLIINDLNVGEGGSFNSMTISGGGNVTSAVGYIGNNATSTDNTVTVTGTNSTWTNSGLLTVGYGGSNNTLTVANNGTVSASGISIASQAGSGGTLNIGTFGGNSTGGTINAPSIAFGDGTGTINFNQSNAVTLSANISGGGSVNILGTGNTTLSGSNSYTGDTTLGTGSALRVGNVNALSGTTVVHSNNAGLQFVIPGANTYNIGGLAGNSSISIGNNTLSIGANNQSTGFSGAVYGNGSIIKSGTGRLSLSGNNTYSGGTSVNAGTLQLQTDIFAPGGALFNVGNMSVASGATLITDRGNLLGNLTLNGGRWVDDSGFGGSLAGSVELGATSTFEAEYFQTVTANITGPGGLVKSGLGILTLSGNNTYTGGTFIESGTLTGNNLGLKGEITNNATLLLGSSTYALNTTGSGNLLVSNNTNAVLLGNATLMTGGTTIQSGNLTIGGRLSNNDPYIAGSISGNISNEGQLFFDLSSGTKTYGETISGNGSLRTTNVSAIGSSGTLALTGNNTYTGGTFVSVGTVDISGGSLASTGNVTITGGAFEIGSSNQTIGQFIMNSQSAQATGTGTLTTTAASYDLRAGTVSLSLAGNVSITKNSTGSGSTSYPNGRVYLSGNNAASGNITVNAGILSFNTVQSLYSGNNSFWTPEKISVTSNATSPFSSTLALGTGDGSPTSGFNNAQIEEIFRNLTANRTDGEPLTTGLTANSSIGFNVSGIGFTLNTTITDRPDGGSIGMDKIGVGVLTLNASNTFSGPLNIFEGVVLAGRNNSLSPNSSLLVETNDSNSPSGYNVGNFSQQFVNVTLKSGTLAGGTGTINATGNYSMQSGNATANLSGVASLVKTTDGIVYLSGSNSYNGTTIVNASQWSSERVSWGVPGDTSGKLQFQNSASLYAGNNATWNFGNITVNPLGILSVRADETGAQGFTSDQISTLITNLITTPRPSGGFLGGSAFGIDTAGTNMTLSVQLTDSGVTSGNKSIGFVKYGAGNLTLTGNNTHSLITSITGGTLALAPGTTLSASNANLAVQNGVLDMGTTSQSVAGVLVQNGSILGNGTLTSTLNNATSTGFSFGNATIEVDLAGVAAAIIYSPTNSSTTTTLSGNNTYTGNTTVGSYVNLILANVNALSESTLDYTNTGSSIQFAAGTGPYHLGGLSGGSSIAFGNSTLSIGANSMNTTYSGNLTGTGGAIAKVGNGTLILAGNNTYTGGTTITEGTLALGNSGSSGSVVGNITNNASLVFNRSGNVTYTDIIGGTGNITQAGSGILTLGGNQTYTGSTTVTSGTLWLGGSATLASTVVNIASGGMFYDYGSGLSQNTAVQNSGRFDLGSLDETVGSISGNGSIQLVGNLTTGGLGYEDLIAGNITGLAASSLTKVGTGNLTITGSATNGGGLVISAGTLSIGNGGATGSVTGNITNNAALAFNLSNEYTYNGIVSGTGSLEQVGAGTTILGGNNTYSGGTIITVGTLQGTTQSLQGAITNNATLVFNQSTNGTYSGALGGTGDLSKNGIGTLTLSGTGSFSGNAAINSGTLAVTGSLASANTQINSGATLTGSGSLGAVTINSGGILTGNGTAGAVTINSGGAIAPGNSPGTITVGNSIWNGGGIYDWELGNATGTEGTGWDLISSTGTLTIGANATNKFTIAASTTNASGFDPNAKLASWKIAEFAGGIIDFASNSINITTSGFGTLPSVHIFYVSQEGNALNFNYATMATWNAGSGNWSDPVNWVGGSNPVNGVSVEYAGPNGLGGNSTNDNTGGYSVADIYSLAFTSGANASYTIDGGGLTIGEGGIVNNSNSTQTIALNLTLGANQTFAANTANLVVSGNITGAYSLTKEGNQTLTFAGANTYTGETNIDAGTLAIAAGGSLTGTSKIFVGNTTSSNNLSILGAVSTADLTLSHQAGSDNNTVTVGGGSSPASLSVANLLNVGFGGTGNTLDILANGTVTAGSTEIGGYGANNSLNLTGGVLNSTGYLVVGYFADDNALNITAGGNATAGSVTVGLNATSANNTILVSGTGSALHTAGLIYLGENGTSNSLVIQNGGKVVSQNADAVIGFNAGSNGNALSINGTGSQFTNNGTLYVGKGGSENTLAIDNGGSLTTRNARIGHDATSSNNTATISGTGSTWTNTGTLRVGSAGSGNTLAVTSGANVTVGGNTFIGVEGSANSLSITNGGNMSLAGSLVIGNNTASENNSALVSGVGSALSAQNIQIGSGADNKLIVADSGLVSTANIALAGTNATLQIGEGGAAGNLSLTGSILTTGTVTGSSVVFNHTDSAYQFASAMSGDLAVSQIGNGTTILTANNTYEGGTIISAGVLTVASTQALGTTGNITFGGGTLRYGEGITTDYSSRFANQEGQALLIDTWSPNNTVIFASNITAANGTLTKLGAGALVLRGNNSYNGGTVIAGGTLAAQSAMAFGTGNVDLNNNSVLAIGSFANGLANMALSVGGNLSWSSNSSTIALLNGASANITGSLSSNGVVGNRTFDVSQYGVVSNNTITLARFADSDILTSGTSTANATFDITFTGLSQSSTVTTTGNFVISGGVLKYLISSAVANGSSLDIRNSDADFIVDSPTTAGTTVVTGQNPLVKDVIFKGSNNLVVPTGVELTVFGQTGTAAGQLEVQNGTSSVVSGSGTIQAPNGLEKVGGGELDLQSNANVAGIATVVEGLLSVNGQLATTGGVVVNPGATLGGTGVIFGNVVVNGNFSPGNSPGTETIVGNLVLTGANSTTIEIASPTNFDRIVVTGTATLGGKLNAVGYGGYTIAPGSRFDFLQAGSIVGAYDSIIAPEGLRGRFLNSGTVGTLLFGPSSYVMMAINQNQRNVAKALDTFIVATDGDRLAVSIALDSLTTEQFPSAFDQIMPGFYESLANIAIEQAFAQTQMLNQRISSVRLGAAGFQAIGGISQPLMHDKNGKSAADAKDASPIVESATATNWNSWALGTGMFSRSTNLPNLQNYNNDAGGFLVGADYRWSENFVSGLYAGYDYSYAEYNGGGSTKGNSVNFGTYASYAKDGYYADAVIGGGYTAFQTKRSIQFSTIDRTASADPGSGQFTAGINLGKDFEVGKFTLGPIIGAQYTYAGIGSFTESGAESLDLSLGQQNANSLRSTLGGRIAYTWNLNQKIALIPEVRMFWQHEFLNNARNINASLDGGSGAAFDFETTDPYRDSVFAGAGVTAQFGERWNASVFYNVNFGSQTYQSNMVSAGLNFSF